LYVLPPGNLKIRFTETREESGDYLHTGGFIAVHKDNSVEINLTDIVERKDVRADDFEKATYEI